MASTRIRVRATVILILRVLTNLFAAACIVVLLLSKARDVDGSKITFEDVIAYRYMMASAVIAAAYCLLQLPFAMYYACTEKRLIRGDFLPAFDFYADKGIAFLLATGFGAGVLTTLDLKEFFREFLNRFGTDLKHTHFDNFFNKGYIASGLLAGAFLSMALLSICSSLRNNTTTTTKKGFFFR
ncbi:hypothetical protein CCACVL1_22410 [Corchorus capsularis]|uniref:CASP-like protein n=1 Tax=Corchorus capsularis TaxID=210143 RepID=A0A1R3GYZ3_COCAP|nr:hypothetical protein CCACVL1_22410 [Corchorus capsularis]